MQPTNGAKWPKEGRVWCGGMQEAGADAEFERIAFAFDKDRMRREIVMVPMTLPDV